MNAAPRDTSNTTVWQEADDTFTALRNPRGSPGNRGPAFARVLVIDDPTLVQELYAMHVTRERLTVYGVSSGRELCEVLENIGMREARESSGGPRVVLDARGPRMTGTEAVLALRTAGWDTPAILMTHSDDPAIANGAAKLGASVLPKQFSLKEARAWSTLIVLASEPRMHSGVHRVR